MRASMTRRLDFVAPLPPSAPRQKAMDGMRVIGAQGHGCWRQTGDGPCAEVMGGPGLRVVVGRGGLVVAVLEHREQLEPEQLGRHECEEWACWEDHIHCSEKTKCAKPKNPRTHKESGLETRQSDALLEKGARGGKKEHSHQ